jgi:N-acetyl-gamma-glutamyl-phosphate reductase common form
VGDRLRVAVVGASGYTGAETLRWLLGHPAVEVVGVTAHRHAGEPLAKLWPQFHGSDLVLRSEIPDAEVLFLCLPNGEAAELAPALRATCVIDLSGDHRLPEPQHALHYGFVRETPPWLYGLPELHPERLLGADRIANPGCFATALSLALLPLAGKMSGRVAAVGVTGSTGSGATPSATTHHAGRAENLRAYKVLKHQHVPEVEQAIGNIRLDFVPMSGPFRRGILVTFTLPACPARLWETYFQHNPLVRVLRQPPELLHVLGSPRADIGVIEGEDVTVVQCAIDNLCRGAATQAIANLNLRMGWPMNLGLDRVSAVP